MMSSLDQEDRNEISTKQFAFPKQRKEPLEDASHVRNAIARFNQVKGVTDEERDEAWKRIRAAAKKFDFEMDEDDWREVGAGKKGKR
jgi:cell division protein FtsX